MSAVALGPRIFQMDIALLKSKFEGLKIIRKRNDFLSIELNKPTTFFVLCEEYSSKGYWIHPVGSHFINKRQIVCHEVAEAGSCFICDQIRELETKGTPEREIFPFRGPKKLAMNVLVKGEETPRMFLAPRTVGEEIWRTWEQTLNQDNINIFDPTASTAFTVTRTGQGRDTKYQVITAPRPAPIIVGENAEERIAKILRAAANLEQRFQLPSREEQEEAWRNR
jgi:hypothetical protein